MNAENCPNKRTILDLGDQLKRVLKRLKRAVVVCNGCTERFSCPARVELNRAVSQAAQEVLTELQQG